MYHLEPILSSEEEVESEEDISGEESDPGQDNEPSHGMHAQLLLRKLYNVFFCVSNCTCKHIMYIELVCVGLASLAIYLCISCVVSC